MNVDYNTLARDYARHRRAWSEVVKSLVEGGELGPASKVLEVGCGTGNYLMELEQTAGCSVWGIDPSEQMLAEARARSPGGRIKLGAAEQLDFPADYFDLVFSVDVIHHVQDRPEYFRESHRVLKSGGRVCTVTDSEEIIRHRRPLAVYFPETVAVELQRYPRISDLRTMMAAAQFARLWEVEVEHEYELTDSEGYRDKAFSSLLLIPPEAFARGIQRMEWDLQTHPIPAAARYLLLWGMK